MKPMTVDAVLALGYAITSRSSPCAARIDRADWREHMAASHQCGMDWVKNMGSRAADQYRRCHSGDVITVPRAWVQILPNSENGPTKFGQPAARKARKVNRRK